MDSSKAILDRRTFLASATGAALVAASGFSSRALAANGLKLGAAEPFSYDALIARAKEMAGRPYVAPQRPPAEILDKLTYEEHGKIHFNTDHALFADGPGRYPVTFFHLGKFFQTPVAMHVVAKNEAREIIYDDSYFNMPPDSPAHALPSGSGFSGFRFQESRLDDKLDWRRNDWVAFLGASYFRAIGELFQYGLSARGIAIDVAVAGKPEEFPDFTHFYFDTPAENGDSVTVYALLDGPSVAGAYRFVMSRKAGVIMDIDTHVFLRKDVARLGIAPLTSMFWYSEAKKPTAVDWRPEVHDSDGLALWTGGGERIWRPLNNTGRTSVSAFGDDNPRGFGLLQRDRVFEHYLDGVHYERRPSLWVEPLGEWGKGAIELVEIPTDDEIHDNIVAMWVPAGEAKAGADYHYNYRLHWLADEPFPTPLGRSIATRLGNGGQPGQPRPKGVRKFMVEFIGGPLANLPFGVKPEAVLWASRGEFSYIFTEAVPDDVPGHWRAQFDLTVEGSDPVDMRLFLKAGDKVLTETWLYQYNPFGNV
ncbi:MULTISPECIES: glucan biosynthesis protein D [unclassified Chelatococcus]|uniref:glucan biosynthesis protein n=1 Tax=unclassified Chelatococcus TaxID=2638111 RepID=UPI001BCDB9E1|nr:MULTISPECIES: glucan biosynthesis protein D [unclassified Chelatococcus]MBS7696060.1 glucan biosynthesis protein [Chelatococcus sp. YT9]MBX3558043.1 glucan biosynthesis protein [Chelatococcus sp.]